MIVSVTSARTLGSTPPAANIADSSALQSKVNGAKRVPVVPCPPFRIGYKAAATTGHWKISKNPHALFMNVFICCHKANGIVGSRAEPPGCFHSFLLEVVKILNSCCDYALYTKTLILYLSSVLCIYLCVCVCILLLFMLLWISKKFCFLFPLIQKNVIMGTLYQIQPK